jgi:hypothetical protein
MVSSPPQLYATFAGSGQIINFSLGIARPHIEVIYTRKPVLSDLTTLEFRIAVKPRFRS